MLVRLGNSAPHQCVASSSGEHTHETIDGPAVTYCQIPDGTDSNGTPLYGVPDVPDDPAAAEQQIGRYALHLAQHPDITSLPGHESLLVATHPSGGAWAHHSATGPSWVHSDHPGLARLLSLFYGCPVLPDTDLEAVEQSHYTFAGPPGTVPPRPTLPGDATMNITQNGRDIWALALGGGLQVGQTGAATASSATTLTTTFTTSSTSQFNGQRIYASVSSSAMVFGIIQSCTSGANAVFTVDRWYTPSTPGGSAGSTPSSTATWVICDGAPPAWFMGISTSTSALATPSTNSSLPSEITTSGGGLIRKICPWAHTASANTYTLTPVYTANGSDSLPVTIGSIGVFISMVVAATTETMLFNTLLSSTATLTTSGDQLTITETVTGT